LYFIRNKLNAYLEVIFSFYYWYIEPSSGNQIGVFQRKIDSNNCDGFIGSISSRKIRQSTAYLDKRHQNRITFQAYHLLSQRAAL